MVFWIGDVTETEASAAALTAIDLLLGRKKNEAAAAVIAPTVSNVANLFLCLDRHSLSQLGKYSSLSLFI